jgi:hypothetical protein
MPSSTFFGDDDPAFDYDLSLAACVYLADRFGERRLWRLLEALARAGFAGDPETAQRRVLRRELGLGPRRLAREAARVIVAKG